MPSGTSPVQRTASQAQRVLVTLLWSCLLLVVAGLAYGWWSFYRGPTEDKPAAVSENTFTLDTSKIATTENSRLGLTDLVKTDSQKLFQPSTSESDMAIPEKLTEEARQLVTQFRSADNWQKKLSFIVNPERTESLLRDYYEVRKQSDPQAGDKLEVTRHKLLGKELLVVSAEGNYMRNPVEAALLKDASGQWRMDWESYVGFGEMGWEDFITQRKSEPVVFRVHAQVGDYWNHEFSDTQVWGSVKLRSPESEKTLHGHCRLGSGLGRELMGMLRLPPKNQALTLRLAFPPKSQSDHCVEITGLVAERWLVLPP
jgi:hypothetical protein